MNGGIPPGAKELRALTNQGLVERLIGAASAGNEYDNREVVVAYKAEVLRRLARARRTP